MAETAFNQRQQKAHKFIFHCFEPNGETAKKYTHLHFPVKFLLHNNALSGGVAVKKLITVAFGGSIMSCI